MGHLNGPYYPHALIQGFAYDPFCLCPYYHFDIPSVMHLRANYLAFNMYLGKQYRLYYSLYRSWSYGTKLVKILSATELP